MQLPRLSLLDFDLKPRIRNPPLKLPHRQPQQNQHIETSQTHTTVDGDSHQHPDQSQQHRSISIPVPLKSPIAHEYNNTNSLAQSLPLSSQQTIKLHSGSSGLDVHVASSLPVMATSKTKKSRTRTTKEQTRELQKVFDVNPLPNMKQRQELGALVGMTPRAVQVWFQNKRQSMKKLQLPLAAAAETTSKSMIDSPVHDDDESSSRPPSPAEDLVAIALLGISSNKGE